ncbi:hypothetical protein R5R35_006297 [Gryllus longicercus]|uniref:Pacifastin domain-containing protein n=1 Tax=Gryllus longicercus TaxID=2509291 RepID=A0AAN9WF62_9ORTH
MRNGGVLLLLTVAALAALCVAAPSGDGGGESYPQGPCEAGSEVSYQCNTCTCTQDGTGYACTRQLCPPPERERRQANCVPGRAYPSPDGCNTCACTSTGVLACTQRLCINPSTPAN